MSTQSRRSKRSSQLSPHERQRANQTKRQRLLAPKTSPCYPVQYSLQLAHNSIQVEQDTEAPPTTLQSCIQLSSVSSGYEFTSPPLLPPGSTVLSLGQKQYAVVAPESVVDTHRSVALSTQEIPFGNLQLQETMKKRHGEDGEDPWRPAFHAPEDAVWTAMSQLTTGVHQYLPTVTASTQQLPLAQPALSQENVQHVACINGPSIWCYHLESITLSDSEEKGIGNLKRSYRDLRQHIHEAHQSHCGATCSLCENLFCYHLGKMILLEVSNRDFANVKVDLGNSFLTLRQHIQEAHGGC
ncbi:hypothetical protein EV426DRAFT_429857 [Tirmania nivea]|nr:hypothetical protein EV426DRAFT_429857 [Tirmania nivea]